MRWLVFGVAAYLLMVLQVGLAPHIAMATKLGSIEPQFPLVLVAFVALCAPPKVAMSAAALLGLLLDAVSVFTVVRLDDHGQVIASAGLVVIGPYILGYMAAAYMVFQFRPMFLRQHPGTITTMTGIAGIAAMLVVLGLFCLRRFYEPMDGFSAQSELVVRALGVIYSVAVALAISFPLSSLAPLFGFQSKMSLRTKG